MRGLCGVWLAFFAAACSGVPSPSSPASPTSINRAPSVTVAFHDAAECYPAPARGAQPAKPCSLTVVATATDPDGDPLSHSWSGCATGTSAQATCTVTQPGPVTASVEVRDDRGGASIAHVVGAGVNHPPAVTCGDFLPLPAYPTSPTLASLIAIHDPDEGLCGGGFGPCPYLQSVTISGDCQAGYYLICSCTFGGEMHVYRTAPAGACSISISVKDSWGLVGAASYTIQYSGSSVQTIRNTTTATR